MIFIMIFSLYNQFGARNSPPIWGAVKAGLEYLGHTVVHHNNSADVAVIWSLVWAGRMRENKQVWNEYRNTNRNVIVLEVGMLQRGTTWKLGLNGINNTAYPWAHNHDDSRANQLGLVLTPWTNSGDKIIVCTQRTDSEQWSGQPELNQWIVSTVNAIKQFSDRKVIVRPHPRFVPKKLPPDINIQLPRSISGTYDSFDFNNGILDAWAVVNHNSGPGTQAILNGVPAFVGTTSLAGPVANFDLANIENPMRPKRQQWLNNLAYTEWTIDEIQQGLPIKLLLSKLS